MNEEFLVDQISMPAKTRRDVINACDLKVDLRGKDLVQLRTDLSSVRGPHVERIEDYFRDARRGSFQTVLFSGHIGSGKTTELRWLARRLQETRDDRTFHVVWVDANEYLDIYSVQVPEVLLALVSAILDDGVLRPMIRVSTAAQKLWTTIVETLKPIGVELEASLPVGSGSIKAKIKKEPGFQKRAREALRERVAPIIELLAAVLSDVRAGLLKQGVDDVVIIVDNLEKVLFLDGAKPDEPNAHDLFFVEQLPVIEEIHAHVVVTVPVSMHFRHNRLRQVFSNPMVNVLPMVPVTDRARDAVHEEGVAALRALLSRRADLGALFASAEACDHAIALSGGAIRDLFRIVIEAVSFKRDLHLTVDEVDRGARELVSSYQRLLSGRDYLPKLVSIANTGDLASGLSDDDRRKLLQSMVVLEYNGTTWYDVHPLARRTTAFERARIESIAAP